MGRLDIRLAAAPGPAAALGAAAWTTTGFLLNPFATNNLLSLATGEEVGTVFKGLRCRPLHDIPFPASIPATGRAAASDRPL